MISITVFGNSVGLIILFALTIFPLLCHGKGFYDDFQQVKNLVLYQIYSRGTGAIKAMKQGCPFI